MAVDMKGVNNVSGKSSLDTEQVADFIKSNFTQRQCKRYVPNARLDKDFCLCGRTNAWHGDLSVQDVSPAKWHLETDTEQTTPDCYGEISFRGFGHETRNRAPYVRVGLNVEALKELESFGNIDQMVKEKRLDDYMSVAERAFKLEESWKLITEMWGVNNPKLLISVTGGATRFTMKPRLTSSFKKGLIKAAISTGAWIITGGTSTGVMQFVGEAVREHEMSTVSAEVNTVISLGIATWGGVDNRTALVHPDGNGSFPALYRNEDLLKNKGKKGLKGIPLDHNHSHFILVDNGTENAYGAEIAYRANLEHYITTQLTTGITKQLSINVPVVLLVVEGGANTISTVYEAVKMNHPVVIVKGSGRAADLLTFACTEIVTTDEHGTGVTIKSELENELKRKTQDLFKNLNYDANRFEESTSRSINTIKKILCFKHLITIYNVEENKDIDVAILDSLMKANMDNAQKQLHLSLAWNKPQLAKEHIFTFEQRAVWTKIRMDLAMEAALVQDRIEFVKLLMVNGVDLRQFLTYRRLRDLYLKVITDKYSSHAADLIRHKLRDVRISWTQDVLPKCCLAKSQRYEPRLLNHVGDLIIALLGDQFNNPYPGAEFVITEDAKDKVVAVRLENSFNASQPEDKLFVLAERELFLWAILTNRPEMAKLFWRMAKDPLGGALIGSALLKRLSNLALQDEEVDLANEYMEASRYWEKTASGLLSACYIKDKYKAFRCLIRKLYRWGDMTCFQIAHSSELMNFMGNSCCQTKLNRVWLGNMALYTSTWKLIVGMFMPLVIFLIKFVIADETAPKKPKYEAVQVIYHKKVSPSTSEEQKNQKTFERSVGANQKANIKKKAASRRPHNVVCCGQENGAASLNFFQAWYYFLSAPVVKFGFNMFTYVVYLALFSMFMLTDLRPVTDPNSPSILEYFVWAWTTTLIIEEIRQIYSRPAKSLGNKLSDWFQDMWNKVDLLMYLLFIGSVILRLVLTGNDFLAARMCYTVTLAIFYLRFMHMFFVQKAMGPKIIMIKKMMTDLMFFLLIFVVFCLGYGVITQALLYPNTSVSVNLLKDVVYKPYFHIYGELFLEEYAGDVQGCSSNLTEIALDSSKPRCPDANWLAPILLAIYMVLTNVLLLNLLIAMFSYTFQNVQDNSEIVWRFYRYALIQEYYDRPVWSPPLIIFNHIYRLMLWLGQCFTNPVKEGESQYSSLCKAYDHNEDGILGRFEYACMEKHVASVTYKEAQHVENKVGSTAERIEHVISHLEELKDHVTNPKPGNSDRILPPDGSGDASSYLSSQSPNAGGQEVHALTDRVKTMEKNITRVLQLLEQKS